VETVYAHNPPHFTRRRNRRDNPIFYMAKAKHPYQAHYKKLVGHKVTSVVIDDTKATVAEFGQPVYGLQFDDGKVAWIMSDPEGNAPGFLDITK